jgi:regulator of replication initiation timing
MSDLTLVLGSSNFTVAAHTLRRNSSFFTDHPALQTYNVQTPVSAQTFREFICAIGEGSELPVRPDNASDLSSLCEEFGVASLKRACDRCLSPASVPASIDVGFKRGEAALEAKLAVAISAVEDLKQEVRDLKQECGVLKAELLELRNPLGHLPLAEEIVKLRSQTCAARRNLELSKLKTAVAQLQGHFRTWVHGSLDFRRRKEAKLDPLDPEDGFLDGIIAFLAKSYGGNVYDNGIVTITPQSRVAAFVQPEALPVLSESEPGEWICWDFHEMRVTPASYTIWGWGLKSWVLDGSVDGENWTEMDLQTDTTDFQDPNKVCFAVHSPVESRFIRLTQTEKTHEPLLEGIDDFMCLLGVEFFGTLSK